MVDGSRSPFRGSHGFRFTFLIDDLHALRICYTAFINVLVMFVMILLLYRSIIGYQDDIVTRTLGFAADLFGDDGRGGNGTVGVPAAS